MNTPWYRAENDTEERWEVRDSTGFRVARGWHFLNEQHEAIARLVSAAPELLAALKWAMAHVRMQGPSEEFADKYNEAAAAIRKAEGRTS